MSVLFTTISSSNPVTNKHVQDAFNNIGVQVSASQEKDYVEMLQAFHESIKSLDLLPDYQPVVDYERFARRNVCRVEPQNNVLGNAWSYTFSIKDQSQQDLPTPVGLLHNKTVCLKDCITVAANQDNNPARVLEAGAEVVGTAMSENLCQSTSSNSAAQGIVENPHALGYSAGGSTSGAAALVGAGLVDIALGADQGGSIRVPAALCGIVGLKPTFGLLPYTGIGSNDAINDHAGPLARTVMEVAECLEATAGYDGIDDRQLGACAPNQVRFSADLKAIEASGLQGFKIGILKEAFEMPILDARVAQKVLTAAAMFKTLGATVEEVSVPLHPAGNAIWTAQQRLSGCLTMLGLTHGRRGLGLTGLEQTKLPWTQAKFDKCFATTQNVFLNGQYLIQHFPTIYPKALNLGRRLRDEYEAVLQEFDVLILPTTSFVARKHGIRDNTRPIEQIKPTVGLTANTVQFNATGQPAMNLPIGRLSAEDDPEIMLPVGMQIVSGLWRDNVVLRVGHVWEKNFDWKQL